MPGNGRADVRCEGVVSDAAEVDECVSEVVTGGAPVATDRLGVDFLRKDGERLRRRRWNGVVFVVERGVDMVWSEAPEDVPVGRDLEGCDGLEGFDGPGSCA